MNNLLATLDEEQVRMLLDHECTTRRRAVYISRLHQRFSKLRSARERAALLGLQPPAMNNEEIEEPEEVATESTDNICPDCNGSGEGMWEGTTCHRCHGRGTV